MEIRTIYRDEYSLVKAVWYRGEFLYTKTYILQKEEEGKPYVEKMITVFKDGTVDIQ